MLLKYFIALERHTFKVLLFPMRKFLGFTPGLSLQLMEMR